MINNLFMSFQSYLKDSISLCGGNPREVELPFNVKLLTNLKKKSFFTLINACIEIILTIFEYSTPVFTEALILVTWNT